MAEHRRLGRGLAALIGDVGEENAPAESGRKPRRAPIESLMPNPRNPRRDYTDAELDELAASIRERGIIQPIVVREAGDNTFEIIAGERRWRAAQRASLHDVPIAVVDATDAQSLEYAIIENVQRADLNPIEEAAGYIALMEQCNHTQEQVAQIVGKSRPYVANMVRLMKLPEPVKAMVRAGKLSAGHARLLVGHANAQVLAEMAIEIDATRLLTWEAAWRIDRDDDATREACLARRYAATMALKVTDNAVQVLGGHGYIRDHLVELFLRNARGFGVIDGLAMA